MRNSLCLVSDPLKYGRGHLARQLLIQKEFENLGVQYTIRVNKVDSLSTFSNQGTTLILDLSYLDEQPTMEFLRSFGETIGFDWSGKFIPDRNFVVLQHPQREYPAKKYCSTGLQNLVIRSDIAILKNSQSSFARDYLLISLGYSAKTKAYQHALELCEGLPKIRKVLASGSALEIKPSEDLKCVTDSPDFIQLLSEAKGVITNGGTTYIESLLLGKSVLPVPQTKDEQDFIDAILPLTLLDVELPGFRKLDIEKALKAGVGTEGAKRLSQIMLENS